MLFELAILCVSTRKGSCLINGQNVEDDMLILKLMWCIMKVYWLSYKLVLTLAISKFTLCMYDNSHLAEHLIIQSSPGSCLRPVWTPWNSDEYH